MSTRSVISMKVGDDKYRAIYCHSDGYLTFNGAMLFDHYTDENKVKELLDLGDISCLGPLVNPDPTRPHSFDYEERQENVVVAYARDRGEKKREAREFTLEELKEWDWIEYIYIFDENKKWKYLSYPFVDGEGKTLIKDVEEDLAKEYKSYGIKRPKGFYGFWTEESLKEEKKRQEQGQM